MVLPPKVIHPTGERDLAEKRLLSTAIEVETFAGKVHVEWDPAAAVTPIGQLPFFIEFLKLGHRFNPWVEECPAGGRGSTPIAEMEYQQGGQRELALIEGPEDMRLFEYSVLVTSRLW